MESDAMSERDRQRLERDDLAAATNAIWEANAAFWDERMGNGNSFQLQLIGPATERLLALRPDERVLEVACGNGVMARRLAELGARVLATDVSSTFIARARARSTAVGDRLEYYVVDATDEATLLALGAGAFDAIVCNMALMDMPRIEPLLRAARALLKPGSASRFVFSIMHPCFNSGDVRFVMEEDDIGGELRLTRAVKISGYRDPDTRLGLGMVGQPQAHYYFHRPLHVLLGAAFAAGFVLDGLEEPAFTEPDPTARPLSWAQYTAIPPILVARLR
jgi:2-polyprenyl-3-methyl-5-hydroxy-6-metoxy-1,4-benzoquinol methylase